VYLARSANLPEVLYILLALISSFFLYFFTMSEAISASTGPIFTIFSPNGRYLREFSRSGHTEGKLILRAFFARLPDGSTVLVCCYLLGGDTAAPSGLYARLCHAFLVVFCVDDFSQVHCVQGAPVKKTIPLCCTM